MIMCETMLGTRRHISKQFNRGCLQQCCFDRMYRFLKSPDFLKLHPLGKLPVLTDYKAI